MEKVLVLDFGSQLTLLIARRVREQGIYCEVLPASSSITQIKQFAPKAIILSGGPASVLKPTSPMVAPGIFELGVPILGICYGLQLMCKLLGGKLVTGGSGEFGKATITIKKPSALYKGVWQKSAPVWMSHGDSVITPPAGFEVVASSKHSRAAIVADEKRKFYGVQFHPEVTHTPKGEKLLSNFLRGVAGLRGDWSMPAFLRDNIQRLKRTIGKRKVICAVSGGVDSTVCAVLLERAGVNLETVFVDGGLLRKNEAEEVCGYFEANFKNFTFIDAKRQFLTGLKGVIDPEKKRKIIGKTFIKVFYSHAKKSGAKLLAQGTLYPDVIESQAGSVTIKSHHNVGGLPKNMPFKLVEPLRLLFKDEVRALGKSLGIGNKYLMRHPFPGPGLAVRLPASVTPQKLALLREVDFIYLEELQKARLMGKIWQAFAVLLPVRSTAVMGDARRRGYTVALRAVVSQDAMTASSYPIPHGVLNGIATRIINECDGIARVLYDVTSKPPATIEWE